ncbi:MAG: PhnD/SsuA/transferrin family substrate-binding protein [Gammaproteobacteria bacterium]|nr:PhnD/SsuA/transferrin family substrate-binding protein [Gammaproteobacteria bacterium]
MSCFTANAESVEYAETITFITAPTHSKQKTTEIYTPITEYLTKKTGKEVKLILPINFLDYINKMRKGVYDITFDGPHFASWRIKNLGDTPIVRLPGKIKIAVVSKSEYKIFDKLDDLIGQRVCAFASPNLLTMAYLDHYTNPIQTPIPVPAKGFKGLVKCLNEDKGKAVVLRDKMWNKMDKTGLKLIDVPEHSYPDRTFTISSRIDSETQRIIHQALISPEAKAPLSKLLKTFKKPELITASKKEYDGTEQLLRSIWAFKTRQGYSD